MEQVVAGVRVAVERLHPVQAAEHEAEDALAGEVALVLVPREDLPPRRADDELAGQHLAGRQRRHDGGDVDERVAAVEVGELGWFAASRR